jgi:hypothetical protein
MPTPELANSLGVSQWYTPTYALTLNSHTCRLPLFRTLGLMMIKHDRGEEARDDDVDEPLDRGTGRILHEQIKSTSGLFVWRIKHFD